MNRAKRFIVISCILSGGLLACAAPLRAQPQGNAGLETLNDERLLSELAQRRLESLLQRAFEVNRVPDDKQRAMRVVMGLNDLMDPKSKMSPIERQNNLKALARDIDAALPSMSDPQEMMRLASSLIRSGIERDVNTLEYWGENPKTQASLRPMVEAVLKILDKTAMLAADAALKAENKIKRIDDPNIQAWIKLTNLKDSAKFTRNMVVYYQTLSMDAADPQRKIEADKAIQNLKVYDNTESQLQPAVRNRMAKLNMTKGEYAAAKKLFATVITTDPRDPVKPKPDTFMVYEARYFSALCDVMSRNPAAARRERDQLKSWQDSNISIITDRTARAQAEAGSKAALAMLNFRILSLDADLAAEGPAKDEAKKASVDCLLALLRDQPGLQTIIFDLLLERLPANPDAKSINDSLVLQAMMGKGQQECEKKPAEMDKRLVDNGIAAARELSKRVNVPPILQERASLALAYMLDKLDRRLEAANALLDYVAKYKSDLVKATPALQNAGWLIGQMRLDNKMATEPGVMAAYERFLELAVARPFSMRQFAYEYGRLLQRQSKYEDAVTIFRLVPNDSKRVIEARYYEMTSMKFSIDAAGSKQDEIKRTGYVRDIQSRASEVKRAIDTELSKSLDQPTRLRYRAIHVNTTLIAADVARKEQKDYDRVLSLLEGFENTVVGLDNETELIGNALFQRVQAYMAKNMSVKATDELAKLLKADQKAGQGIIYTLLTKLNEDLERARDAGDRAAMRDVANSRAVLSGFLIDWAMSSTNPDVKNNLYTYKRFDASTKALAADLQDNDTERLKAHRIARELYKTLQSKEWFARFMQTVKPEDREDTKYDAVVVVNIGLLSYDIGEMGHDLADYKEAQLNLGRLLYDHKIGKPLIEKEQDNQVVEVDNDQYWDAMYKLFRSNVILSKEKPQLLDETKSALKQLIIQWNTRVGGTKLKAEFARMREEVLPGFDPTAVAATQPATPPTTRPTPR